MTVSWYAKVIPQHGLWRTYHLYERNGIPSSRFILNSEIENAARFAYVFYHLNSFSLQCFALPEVRRFHRTWLMDFEVELTSATSKVNIKGASFNVSEKVLWNLREEFRTEGKFKADPKPRLIDPVVNPMISTVPEESSRMYDLGLRKHSTHTGSRIDIPHGPVKMERPFKPTWRKALSESWKESEGASHSG